MCSLIVSNSLIMTTFGNELCEGNEIFSNKKAVELCFDSLARLKSISTIYSSYRIDPFSRSICFSGGSFNSAGISMTSHECLMTSFEYCKNCRAIYGHFVVWHSILGQFVFKKCVKQYLSFIFRRNNVYPASSWHDANRKIYIKYNLLWYNTVKLGYNDYGYFQHIHVCNEQKNGEILVPNDSSAT